MSSSLGHCFRITTWGESHGEALGVVIEGCPPGIKLNLELIQQALDRRRPGQSSITTTRKESDQVWPLSGLAHGITMGSPLTLVIFNEDARPSDYQSLKDKYRPSHGDYTYHAKFGIPPLTGGGRLSARETAARVIAGAVAQQVLASLVPELQVTAYVSRVHDIDCPLEVEPNPDIIESNLVRCADSQVADQMKALIVKARSQGDSVGGAIRCIVSSVPLGLGEPVFDKLEADLAKAMLSIPSCVGFEYGDGFEASYHYASENNDAMSGHHGSVHFESNHSGGIQGGMSNGQPIRFQAAFKPPSTIAKTQATIDLEGESTDIEGRGRHDPCVLPRAVPIVEAMTWITLIDHFLRDRAQVGPRSETFYNYTPS